MMRPLLRAENEWRHDLVDNAWTLVARNRRTTPPLEVSLTQPERKLRGAGLCAFCDEVEHHALDRVRGAGDSLALALPSPTPLAFVEYGPPPQRPFESAPALGAHELLVPLGAHSHGKRLSELNEDDLTLLLWLFTRRRAALAGDERLRGVGFSLLPPEVTRLVHLHAALFAVPFEAPRFSSPETCPACRELTDARAKGRVLVEDEEVVAFVPFAPRGDLHVRVASSLHGTHVLDAAHALDHARGLARVLVALLERLSRAAPRAPLALSLRPVPLVERRDGFSGHVLLEVHGLQEQDTALGAALGARIVTLPPEERAALLRGAAPT
jgi:galactose-1-phosphate uridylyltransferase